MELYEILLEIMEERDLTIAKIAKICNIPDSTVRGIIKRKQKDVALEVAFKLSNGLGISLERLNGMEEPECDKEKNYYDTHATEEEFEKIVKKYRSLDDSGKERIDYELKKECERIREIEELKNKLNTEFSSEITPMRVMAYYQRVASAGSGEYLFDDLPTDLIEVEDTPLSRKADFVLGVIGNSMFPTFKDGEKVFIKKASEIPTGKIGVFTIGNDCYIKELGIDRLISHNEDKETYPDIISVENARIVGEVIGKVGAD